MQETLLTVWVKAELFDPAKAGAATWVFAIARNLWIDGSGASTIRVSWVTELRVQARFRPVMSTSHVMKGIAASGGLWGNCRPGGPR